MLKQRPNMLWMQVVGVIPKCTMAPFDSGVVTIMGSADM